MEETLRNSQKERYASETRTGRENALLLLSQCKERERILLDSGFYEYVNLNDDFNTMKLKRKENPIDNGETVHQG